MTLTPEQKEHAIDLIEMGEKLEAVRYFQQTLQLDAEQALALTEKLEAEIEAGSDLDAEFETKVLDQQPAGANVGKLVGFVFMSIGIIMLSVVLYLIYSYQQFEKRAKVVKGNVTDYQTHISQSDNSSTTMYAPVFEYVYKGKTRTYVSTTSSNYKEYELGKSLDMFVDPEHPEEVLVNSFSEKWFLPMLLGFMGILFTGLGYLAYRMLDRSQ